MHFNTSNRLNYYLISLGVYVKYTNMTNMSFHKTKKKAEYANQYAYYVQHVNMQNMLFNMTKNSLNETHFIVTMSSGMICKRKSDNLDNWIYQSITSTFCILNTLMLKDGIFEFLNK